VPFVFFTPWLVISESLPVLGSMLNESDVTTDGG